MRPKSSNFDEKASPLTALADSLVEVAIVTSLGALLVGVGMPPAASGDDAAQDGTNDAVTGPG